MTLASRVRSIRRILAAAVVVRAIAWGVAAALSVAVLGALVDAQVALSVGTRQVLLGVAGGSFLAVAGALAIRDRSVSFLPRVALWVEERDPALAYRLVTALETGDDTLVPSEMPARWSGIALRHALRGVALAVGVAMVALIAMLTMPSGAVARLRLPRPGDAVDRAVARGGSSNRLTPLAAEVVPPAYTGVASQTIDEPSDVRAPAGSAITLCGAGDASGIIAVSGADTVRSSASGGRWSIALRAGAKPAAWRITDGRHERIVAVEPVVDEPPTVTLVTPAHDSVLRQPRGRLPLAAEISDDYGVASSSFEVIVSSGEGESFVFRSTVLRGSGSGERGSGTRKRRVSLSTTLSIDSLALKPGDIVHLRAVARDANDVTGVGVGTSETRTIRIARADEYDSVSVEAAPPGDADKSVISERMLITLAEALEKKRASLARPAFVNESRSIAADQKQLRRTVGEIVFTHLGGESSGEEHSGEDSPTRAKTMEELLARADSATNAGGGVTDFEGGESPVVAVNKPLLEAYNAMWDASTQLEIGEPARALPHMRRALAAIERARQAERLYLRGRPPQVVIDVAKVRLQGKDKGASSTRRALSPADSAGHVRAERFSSIVAIAATNASAAADSLLLLRIDALIDAPDFASALGDAATALRRGRSNDAMSALVRARRALGGAPTATDSITRWGIVP